MTSLDKAHRYDDIINKAHPEPFQRERMSLSARAAQFAAFQALTGQEELVEETARAVRLAHK